MDRRSFLASTALGLAAPLFIDGVEVALASSGRVLSALPKSSHRRVAWTVDDGFNDAAIVGYLKMLEANQDVKVTFFVTSMAAPWAKHASRIRDLIDVGQVQVANHTHTHARLTQLSSRKIKNELNSCRHFLEDKYGDSGAPFYRPPFGYYDRRVRSIAAELGYHDTVMWFGTLADSGHNTHRGILRNADKWMRNGRIVIGHANHPEIVSDLDEIVALLASRNLKTVTLGEVFS